MQFKLCSLLLSLLSFVSLICAFAIFDGKSLSFMIFYFSVKNTELPQCMKCAIIIRLPCLA